MRSAGLAACLSALIAVPAMAQDTGWRTTASIYGWFSGLDSTVETQFGDIEADLDFSEVWDNLEFAVFGGFEARNGRLSLIADLVYADLKSTQDTPFGVLFSEAEVRVQTTLVSLYAAYDVANRPDLRVDLGGGLRYNNLDLEIDLDGNAVPDESSSSSVDWVDPLLAGRVLADLNEKWFVSAFADVGGFGIGDASDLTWQAYGGVGYRINETWALQAGYRYLSIDREFDGNDSTLAISGPILGVQAAF